MSPDMQFVTPASAIEAILRVRGFTVTTRGKDIDVSLPKGKQTITLNPRSYVASFGNHNHQMLKGKTPNEIADELAALLSASG